MPTDTRFSNTIGIPAGTVRKPTRTFTSELERSLPDLSCQEPICRLVESLLKMFCIWPSRFLASIPHVRTGRTFWESRKQRSKLTGRGQHREICPTADPRLRDLHASPWAPAGPFQLRRLYGVSTNLPSVEPADAISGGVCFGASNLDATCQFATDPRVQRGRSIASSSSASARMRLASRVGAACNVTLRLAAICRRATGWVHCSSTARSANSRRTSAAGSRSNSSAVLTGNRLLSTSGASTRSSKTRSRRLTYMALRFTASPT